MSAVLDRFLNYIQLDTTSLEESETYPSSPNQLEFGRRLVQELKGLGLKEVRQDGHGYVTAIIPATRDGGPVLGLMAHMDTSNAVSGKDIHAKLVEYMGGDILLNEAQQIVMRSEEFPFLAGCIGKTLVVTDGTTLLGADDKAGVAEVVTLAERLMEPDAPPHGEIRLAFTPDEEISGGTRYFDIPGFGANFAYTVDGGPIGELEYETFNAATATIEIAGRSIHPGAAKGKMVNAVAVACELQSMLPPKEQPVFTEGHEGFYHLLSMHGEVEHCTMKIALREHDGDKFQAQKDCLNGIARTLNSRWGEGTVSLTIRDQYYNMRPVIEKHMEVVEQAVSAFRACGIEPRIQPVRGGTDGARLSLAGLPCPNLSTGGYNFHSRFECIPVESMECMVDVLTNLVCSFGKEGVSHV